MAFEWYLFILNPKKGTIHDQLKPITFFLSFPFISFFLAKKTWMNYKNPRAFKLKGRCLEFWLRKWSLEREIEVIEWTWQCDIDLKSSTFVRGANRARNGSNETGKTGTVSGLDSDTWLLYVFAALLKLLLNPTKVYHFSVSLKPQY